MNIHVQVFIWTYVFISLGYVPSSGNAGSHGNSTCNFLRNRQTVFQSGWLHHSTSPPAMYECPNFVTFSLALAISHLFDYSHPNGFEMPSHVVLICIFLIGKAMHLNDFFPPPSFILQSDYHNKVSQHIHHLT